MPLSSVNIARLTPGHADAYRTFMLRAFAREPEAFTVTYDERASLPLEWWTSRIADGHRTSEVVFGAFEEERIIAAAGLRFERGERTSHKATLFGMYVAPERRGRGLARALVDAVLAHARTTPGLRVVQLRVFEANEPARRLYAACGFVPFGTEPLAVRMGEVFVSIVHMWRPLE